MGSNLFGVRVNMSLYEFICLAHVDLIFGGNHGVHDVKEEVHRMVCSFGGMTKKHRGDFINVPPSYEAIFLWEREEFSSPIDVHILQLSRIMVGGVVTISEVHLGVSIRDIE